MDLDRAAKTLLIKDPFYGLFLLNLNRYYGDKCDTACVCRNGINTELCVNKDFWDKLTDDEQLGVLKHELGHILFKHIISSEYFADHNHFNVAADCEVNSYIPVLQKSPYCYPAHFKLANSQGTKFYYEKIPKDNEFEQPQDGGGDSNSEYNPQDSHSHWKDFQDMSETERKLVENQIDYQAKNTAEQCRKMIGSLPGEFKDYIDELFKQKPQVFNWKAYFRRVIGNLITSELYLTRMRPSRRFPDSRGVKFKRKPHVLVGVDTSGSVSNAELEDFFSEIHYLWKTGVKVTIAQMDTKIEHIEEYTGTFKQEIFGRGGTEFTDLINYYNEHRKDFSTVVIFTDGYVSLNLPPFRNGVWVITKNGQHQDYPGTTVYIPNNAN